ncbi:MAG: amylo-alpha-1,6-glucosidase [Candidatus Bathyarchaeia archaeon]
MDLPIIKLSREDLLNVDESLHKEWIITNGLGGYSSSTVLGINTRKYHGLLVAAFNPPRRRTVCLAKLDDQLLIENRSLPLFSNEMQRGINPDGYKHIIEFSLRPFPTYIYEVENLRLKKTIFMFYGRNAITCLYEVFNNGPKVKLRVHPIITCRHFHEVIDRRTGELHYSQKVADKAVEVDFINRGILFLQVTNGAYYTDEKWIDKVYFREEFNRGESFQDDWFHPGFFEVAINSGYEKFAITAYAYQDKSYIESLPNSIDELENIYNQAITRRKEILVKFYSDHAGVKSEDWLSWLIQATDMFIVKTVEEAYKSVIAGYHWFEDWGRDAFISLPGLTLITGRFDDARRIFRLFTKFSDNGLIPNYISDDHFKAYYNAVDAPLWYVNAVLQYLKYTGDFEFVHVELWETLKTMIDHFIKGTIFGIKVDGDGMLKHGPQLTWMDAAVDGIPVTPRAGKAVEIQALWYNALKTLEVLALNFEGESLAEVYAAMAEKAKMNFIRKFWDEGHQRLFDVIDEGEQGDPSPRPNQILAISLDFNMLRGNEAEKVVDFIKNELLTPFGLRSLSKGDQRYIGRYYGDRKSRDIAYHNGTVWPWLLGPFVTAYLKVKGYSEPIRNHAFESFLKPLLTTQINNGGLGVINEIFDGDPPHTPRGCIAQAWSVAEPLRAYIEDVLLIRPKFERILMLNGSS